MTPVSRRAFAAAGLALLVAGCGKREAEQQGPISRREGVTGAQGSGPEGSPPVVADVSRGLGRSVPVRLSIPAVGVDTPVMRLGLAADGTAEVPPLAADDRAGWYRYSPTPGEVGPAVILGHVTVGQYGDGVFRHLARLRRGEVIVVRRKDGTSATFAVHAVRTVARADFPVEDVYGDVGRPELRLITCGGPRTGDEYRDNVIVFAGLSSTAS
ncbi:class F sortase [Streptomyces sp. OF3]|uniref:Class F sortase n=1 Tax=Streptomyces alkaliterrae TaxID=2213162 RepID=A0A7W3WPH1_9ACTN|nr:class F sortase [Streptomyces alkaliterrae]MBB1256127.1 class F sortase [Streptomyces alkaliterrae]